DQLAAIATGEAIHLLLHVAPDDRLVEPAYAMDPAAQRHGWHDRPGDERHVGVDRCLALAELERDERVLLGCHGKHVERELLARLARPLVFEERGILVPADDAAIARARIVL